MDPTSFSRCGLPPNCSYMPAARHQTSVQLTCVSAHKTYNSGPGLTAAMKDPQFSETHFWISAVYRHHSRQQQTMTVGVCPTYCSQITGTVPFLMFLLQVHAPGGVILGVPPVAGLLHRHVPVQVLHLPPRSADQDCFKGMTTCCHMELLKHYGPLAVGHFDKYWVRLISLDCDIAYLE